MRRSKWAFHYKKETLLARGVCISKSQTDFSKFMKWVRLSLKGYMSMRHGHGVTTPYGVSKTLRLGASIYDRLLWKFLHMHLGHAKKSNIHASSLIQIDHGGCRQMSCRIVRGTKLSSSCWHATHVTSLRGHDDWHGLRDVPGPMGSYHCRNPLTTLLTRSQRWMELS